MNGARNVFSASSAKKCRIAASILLKFIDVLREKVQDNIFSVIVSTVFAEPKKTRCLEYRRNILRLFGSECFLELVKIKTLLFRVLLDLLFFNEDSMLAIALANLIS